ncbi:MAG: penicillin acylase family protein [Desulfatibacillaceae bacterium]
MKILKYSVLVLLILAVAAVVAWEVFFRMPLPSYSGEQSLPGLEDKVTVKTDDYGIPHVFASSENDLFYAQGYMTARDRLFQMEVTRLAGRGELSSLFGEATLDSDRFLKTFGIHRYAVAEWEATSDELKKVIRAYVAGVNDYMRTAGSLPREFMLLGAKPGLWKPEDSIAAGLLMAYGLTRSKKADLILYQVGRSAGQDVLDVMIPSYPDFAPRVSRGGGPAPDAPVPEEAAFPGTGPGPYAELFNLGFHASNWMIFDGSKTTTGKPIFTGSPDLEPKLPATFHVIRLKGGRYDVMGGAIPGTPGVSVLGYNGHIAWSGVNGRVDELDYFIEKVNPDNPGQYLTGDGWRDFQVIEETLRVKGDDGIEERPLKVLVSRHGPVISDVLPLAPDNCAVQWVGQEPSGVFEGFLRICRATNFEEFREGCSFVRTPTLNLGYADADGHIGYQYMARPPIRKTPGGPLPVPGWTGEHEWVGYVPFEDLPWDLDPDNGYFGSFNNEAQPTPYHMTNFYLFERAVRFGEIMAQTGKVSPADAREMQLDTVSVVARRWVPLAVEAAGTDGPAAQAADMLRDWDLDVDFDSPAAALFNMFHFRLAGQTLGDDIGRKLWDEHLAHPYLAYMADLALIRIQDDPDHKLWDDQGTSETETRDDIIRRALSMAMADMEKRFGQDRADWEWGKVHEMTFRHPLGSKLGFLNLDPIPTQGDAVTINAGMWDHLDPFAFKSGGVIRMVVDFANPANSTIISPPGQSGQYKSPHYADQAKPWARGEQVPMHFTDADGLEKVLVLRPGA